VFTSRLWSGKGAWKDALFQGLIDRVLVALAFDIHHGILNIRDVIYDHRPSRCSTTVNKREHARVFLHLGTADSKSENSSYSANSGFGTPEVRYDRHGGLCLSDEWFWKHWLSNPTRFRRRIFPGKGVYPVKGNLAREDGPSLFFRLLVLAVPPCAVGECLGRWQGGMDVGWEAYSSPRWPVARANSVETRTRPADYYEWRSWLESISLSANRPADGQWMPRSNVAFIVESRG